MLCESNSFSSSICSTTINITHASSKRLVLARRCDTLIRLVEKENEEADAKKGGRRGEGGAKKRKASDAGAAPAAKKVK